MMVTSVIRPDQPVNPTPLKRLPSLRPVELTADQQLEQALQNYKAQQKNKQQVLIWTEFERLKAENKKSLLKTLLLLPLLPVIIPMSLFFPFHKISGPGQFVEEYNRAKAFEKTPVNNQTNLQDKLLKSKDRILLKRAEFNVTGKPNCLNRFLPFRTALLDENKTIDLHRYDQLVSKILDDSDFYEPSKPAPYYQALKSFLLSLGKRSNVSRTRSFTAKSLNEPSLRYLTAAKISELLFRHPEYADRILKREDKRKLKFLIDAEPLRQSQGSYDAIGNWIILTSTALDPRSTTVQHEFIHALSVKDKAVTDILPFMSNPQLEIFKACREQLKSQHKSQAETFSGRFFYWLTGKPATGIHPYAFVHDNEFLTVTIQAFMTEPQNLRKTEAGQKLYRLYQEIFSIDPLNEIHKQRA